MDQTEPTSIRLTPLRKRILELVRANPGETVTRIAKLAGLYWTSAALQIERLRHAGLVRAERVGRHRVLFATDGTSVGDARAAGLLAEPSCRKVALTIIDHPDRRVWELADLSGMSERAVYHHVKRLADAGLILRGEGGYRGLRADAALLRLLVEARPRDAPPPE